MTYRDWDGAQSRINYQRRWQTAVDALARAQEENRVKDECLALATEALEWYGHNCPVLLCGKAGETLTEIERRLAQLEKDAVSGN